MKKILVVLLFLGTIHFVHAQSADNDVWQTVEAGGIAFSLPADWQSLDSRTFIGADERLLLTIEDACPAETTLEDWADSAAEAIAAASATLLQREMISLPLGEAIHLTWRDTDGRWHSDYYALAGENCLAVLVTAPEETALIAQIVNTISWDAAASSESWMLQADPNLVLTIRTPRSWQKLPVQNSLMVRETFDDVVVQIQYRDMGGTTEVAALQPQFDALYSQRGYAIAQTELILLPAGEALFYRLENVALGSQVQTQLHAILMRDEYLIMASLGADQSYFDEYEQILLQMLDTLSFNGAQVP